MGEALAHIAVKLNASETWGAELSPERSKVAETMLTKVHDCAWQSCKVGRGSVSLIWNNPPYDFDPTTKLRLEQTFLDDTAHVLCEGGILIYIVPKLALGIPAIARHLAGGADEAGGGDLLVLQRHAGGLGVVVDGPQVVCGATVVWR
jgi:hypothetical protein